MENKDKFLWYVLALIGLNFFNHRLGLHAKCLRILLMILCSFLFVYLVLFCLLRITKKRYKEGLSFLLLPINCALIWYFMHSRKKEFSVVLLQIYSFYENFKTSKKHSQCIIPLIIITLILPYVICILCQIFVNLEIEILSDLTFDYQIRSVTWKRIIIFFQNLAFSIFCICFPFYITFSFSVLFHRCSDILLGYDRVLKRDLKRKANKKCKTLEAFFDITNAVRNLNEQLKNVSLFIIFYGLHGVFSAILRLSLNKFQSYDYGYAMMVIYHFSCSILIAFSYTVWGSRISENMMKVKRTATEFLNDYTFGHHASQQNIYYLKRIENEEVVYFSVCGLFCLTKGFLLSALGAILTYGLLIINLNL